MSSDLKNVTQTSDFEVDSYDAHCPSHARLLKTVDTARVSLTAVALLMSITILGTSADALAVYDATHVPAGFMLPLWPDAFDLLAVPSVGLVASIIAMSFFYSINASITVDTLQSWSCRWSDVVMMTRPHFGTLCKQSKAGLYLSILLIPIEAIIMGMGGYQMMLERNISKTNRVVLEQRKAGSPVPSSVRDVEGDHH
ncbi:hypothetical protein COL5a_011416 [Colletotrichum fioriniae]|nr:hypothetical protein COL5a_011416 [Colletotrichum fioriniae]